MQHTDKELARLIREGSEDAFENLVRLYGGLIKSIVHFHLKDISMYQEDCINDILFKIWQNIDRFDADKSTLKNWIGAIAKYRAIDYKRKFYRELSAGELNENIADEKGSLSLLKCEIEEEINSLLENLSDGDREIFVKRYIMDVPVEEIAASEGRTAAYIYNRLSKGRKKLRRLFVKERS